MAQLLKDRSKDKNIPSDAKRQAILKQLQKQKK